MKPRVPLQVDPKFRNKLIELQKKFKENGKERSLREITSDIIDLGALNEIEKNIENIKVDIWVRMDKRRKNR